MLKSLDKASQGKDTDEKEARALRSALLRSFGIWEKALNEGQRDSRLEEKLRRVEKQASQANTAEA
jgi:G:T-mismatch repair DNA endonuclease (very short patch repair protein)